MAKTLGGMIRFFSAWPCLDCFQRGFCDITSIKCNSVTSKIFQKCLIIVPKVWEVTHNVFHHPWHIYQMDFYHFFSSTKDFTFDFSMSHCYTRYRSEEISPGTLSCLLLLLARCSWRCGVAFSLYQAPTGREGFVASLIFPNTRFFLGRCNSGGQSQLNKKLP